MKKLEKNPLNLISGLLHSCIQRLRRSFHLSLTFRIAMHYAAETLRGTILIMIIAVIGYCIAVAPALTGTVHRISSSAPDLENAYSQLIIRDDHVTDAVLLYDADVPDTAGQIRDFLRGFPHHSTIFVSSANVPSAVIRVEFDLNTYLIGLLRLMCVILIGEALRIIRLVFRHRSLEKRVLKPIREITEMAETLSANNLSNRINIAGMKDELKDLAVVINSMLDRIELSYNSQKQFVSDASHELRTPIAVIQGYISMLDRWGKEDEQILNEGIAAICHETQSMKDLVESLLFLARHDKKTLLMEMSVFNSAEVIDELTREMRLLHPEDQFVLAANQSIELKADRNMLKQVLRILLDNAVKYTPSGGTISLRAECVNGVCHYAIADNGPGIQADELPRIFDRFYRSDKARKSEKGGHGLGLSIAKIIVLAHHGQINVKSKPGTGTCFTVSIPQNLS